MKEVYYKEKKASIWKNKKFLNILMGLFIISIMVFSVLYYGLDTSGKKEVEFRGLTFIETNVGWQAYTKGNQRILISSNPEELGDVSFDSVSLSFLQGLGIQKIYFSVNPENDMSEALYDFQRNIPLSAGLVVACYEESIACAKMPIKTCADTAIGIVVVVFKEANETSVVIDGNCLTIEGKNLLSITDKLIIDQYADE